MILDKDSLAIYRQSENVSGITSYNATAVFTGPGKIQPASDIIEGSFDGVGAFEVYNIYTEYMGVKIGDKIVIGGVSYYVKGIEKFTGILRNYVKCLVNTKYD